MTLGYLMIKFYSHSVVDKHRVPALTSYSILKLRNSLILAHIKKHSGPLTVGRKFCEP